MTKESRNDKARLAPYLQALIENYKRDIRRFRKAEKITRGAERAKYSQAIDNLNRAITNLQKKQFDAVK